MMIEVSEPSGFHSTFQVEVNGMPRVPTHTLRSPTRTRAPSAASRPTPRSAVTPRPGRAAAGAAAWFSGTARASTGNDNSP